MAPWATMISPSGSPARLRTGLRTGASRVVVDNGSINAPKQTGSTLRRGFLFLAWRGRLHSRRRLFRRLGRQGSRRGRRRRAALVELRRSITLPGADHPLIGRAGAAVLRLAELHIDAAAHPRERSQLARVVDLVRVARLLAVEALHELGALGHLALEDAPVVALIADDVRSEEQQQIRL